MPQASSPSLAALITQLNDASLAAFGPTAPVYSSRREGRPAVTYINRHRPDAGPWLPAHELFARGSHEHCKAKVRSALRYALSCLSVSP